MGSVSNRGCIYHQHFYTITDQPIPKGQPRPPRQVEVKKRTGHIQIGPSDFSVTLALGKPSMPDACLVREGTTYLGEF